jgi:hypothetical protein
MAREGKGAISFDDLARGLADGSITRGKAIRLMGAALVGGALGSLGIGEAAADPPGCKRNGKTCTRNEQCCSGNCSGVSCQAQSTTTTTSTSTTSTSTTTTSTTTPMCLPSGNFRCTADTQCCSGICNEFVGFPGFLQCNECRSPGGSCADGEQCCNNGFCQANGTCCGGIGDTCLFDADCCGGSCSNQGPGTSGSCSL